MAALGNLISLPTAARRLGLSESELRTLIEKGKINLGISPSGEIVVNENASQVGNVNEQLAAIQRESFEHLRGQRISVTEASEKYGVPRETIIGWLRRYPKAILPLTPSTNRGSRMYLDEADVAYCAKIHLTRQKAGVYGGTPLLDEQGNPNLLKHPALSRYRHERKQT